MAAAGERLRCAARCPAGDARQHPKLMGDRSAFPASWLSAQACQNSWDHAAGCPADAIGPAGPHASRVQGAAHRPAGLCNRGQWQWRVGWEQSGHRQRRPPPAHGCRCLARAAGAAAARQRAGRAHHHCRPWAEPAVSTLPGRRLQQGVNGLGAWRMHLPDRCQLCMLAHTLPHPANGLLALHCLAEHSNCHSFRRWVRLSWRTASRWRPSPAAGALWLRFRCLLAGMSSHPGCLSTLISLQLPVCTAPNAMRRFNNLCTGPLTASHVPTPSSTTPSVPQVGRCLTGCQPPAGCAPRFTLHVVTQFVLADGPTPSAHVSSADGGLIISEATCISNTAHGERSVLHPALEQH